MASIHCIRACVAAIALGLASSAAGQQTAEPRPPLQAASSFTIFVRSVPIGSEQISVTRGAEGWMITSSSRIGAPIDILARRVQIRYSADWKPLELIVDATIKGQLQSLHTVVSGTAATSEIVNGAARTQKTDTVPTDAVLLPNPFFGPYEALAARLGSLSPGATLSAYAAPQFVFPIKIGESSDEQIQTAARLVNAHRTHITMMSPGLPVDADLWGDANGRLLRLSIPAQNLEVVREDIASVAARRVTMSRPNDEQVRIPANGFSLAGTISKPFDRTDKLLPAVVLVAGSGQTDRDETVYNIPIFGQLANSLADAGYLVLRYDKRGVGQSGGRAESATLSDFADDVRAAVAFLDDRKDVDQKRIAAVGHSEGGAVVMVAAAKDKRIGAAVLMAAPGTSGADLILAQQSHMLEHLEAPEAERQAKIDLQKRIQHAVLTGSGWDTIPPALRRQVDTPWFQSLLAFDPAKVMNDVRQPILIVQGDLDTQVEPSNADKLLALARARKKAPVSEAVKVPGINHLLVPATTGEIDEYGMLKDKRVSPAISTAIVDFLEKAVAASK